MRTTTILLNIPAHKQVRNSSTCCRWLLIWCNECNHSKKRDSAVAWLADVEFHSSAWQKKDPFRLNQKKFFFWYNPNQLQRGDSVCDKTNQTSSTSDQPSRTNCNSQSVSEKKERSPRLSSVCSKLVFRDRSLVLSLNCCFSQCWDPLPSSSPSGWFLFVLWVVSVPVGQRGEGETSVPDDWTAVDLWINKKTQTD